VEIKSRKIKNRFLILAYLSMEKGGTDDYHAIEKAKDKRTIGVISNSQKK